MIETERIGLFQKVLFFTGLVIACVAFFYFPIAESEKLFGFYLFVFGFFLSLNFTLFFRWLAIKLNIFDHPHERGLHDHPIPLLGGLAIFFSLTVTLLLFEKQIENTPVIWWILGMSFVILIKGLIDDFKPLSPKVRLLIQFAAAGVVIYHGVRISFLPNNLVGDTFEIILSLIWIVGITNAINFMDGMDGLAAGYIIVAASLLGVVAYQLVMPEYLFVLLALVGACAGFFPFNFRWHKRALIFLGDSGANFLGFFMACMTLLGKWGSRNDVYHSINEVGVVIPLIILGVAVFDTIFTYVMRFSEGKIKRFDHLLTYAGKDHFHHYLHELGLSEKAVVITILLITLCLGFDSIALRNARKIDAIILLIQGVVILSMIGAFMAFMKKTHITPKNGNNKGIERE